MEFEKRFIMEVLGKAKIPFELEDIIDVDMEDLDRLYFRLKNREDNFFIRMWDMHQMADGVLIEYTLFRENEYNSADSIVAGRYLSV